MFSLYRNCLFCSVLLPAPDQRKGEGEHIIPQNIYGFWKSYDVCEDCKRYFGDHVDNLSCKEPNLLRAIKQLNLPDADARLDGLPYKGRDTINGRTHKMTRKKGRYKTKVSQISDIFFECAEDDWPRIGAEWIRRNAPVSLSSEVVEKEIDTLKEKYKKIKTEQITHSDKLRISIRKGEVQEIALDPKASPSISPLIAKIVVCFLRYFFPPEEITKIEEYEDLKMHGRNATPIKSHVINWCPPIRRRTYQKWHQIVLELRRQVSIVDVTFFGNPNWRVLLRTSEGLTLKGIKDQLIERLYFTLDFRNPEQREKYVAFRYRDKKEIEEYKLSL